jgi:predicted dehydrogenase
MNLYEKGSMSSSSRRSFLKNAAAGAVAAPFFIRNLISAPPSSTLRLASFGAGGMAYWTLRGIATHSKVKLACVAEVDSAKLKQVKAEYGGATIYQDWRRMLDKERKNLDIACVGTPDHMHAPMAMMSMRHGLHVYVQKPLAHDIFEVRRLTEFARKKNLVTQMGIQIHSNADYQTAVALVQQGAIGKIKEVHSWSEKKWGDPDPVPEHSDPVPDTLNWDLWLGVCRSRPYLKGYYHPGNWRKRIDFGTATFGDMGCHIFDPVCGALQLTAPISVRSEGPTPSQHNWAINAVIHYVFPATPFTADKTVEVVWYDGDERPPKQIQELVSPVKFPGQGSIFVGTKGVMLLPHIARPTLYPSSEFKDFPMPAVTAAHHYHQFVDAVLGTSKASAAFDYSGPLTESVLLGTVATRFPQTTLNWNAAKLKFDNSKEASRLVRRKYRSGWKAKGL